MVSPEGHIITPNAQAAFIELFIHLCHVPETSPVLSSTGTRYEYKFKFTGSIILVISKLSPFMLVVIYDK